ncbi:MAG TPA: nuclear transport factor 2 family protein [Steroidobacteraceae bacterium]|nr:nuclear transport factor 2 family protein [Steroidobacteraceae bacterium]
MGSQNELEALRTQVEQLTRHVGLLEDAQAVRRVQFAYGYYMDKGLYQEVVDLFADDGEVRFMGGIFRGKSRGVKRLYIERFRTTFTHGRNAPAYGFMLEHLQLQDIIDVAADRKSARGRFRCFMQAGSHASKPDKVATLPLQWWEAGVYENTYVCEGGVWKIQILNYCLSWQADYEQGWAHSKPYEGPFFTRTYPEDPGGPDEITAERPAFWPQTAVVPFHFPHPVTGRSHE